MSIIPRVKAEQIVENNKFLGYRYQDGKILMLNRPIDVPHLKMGPIYSLYESLAGGILGYYNIPPPPIFRRDIPKSGIYNESTNDMKIMSQYIKDDNISYRDGNTVYIFDGGLLTINYRYGIPVTCGIIAGDNRCVIQWVSITGVEITCYRNISENKRYRSNYTLESSGNIKIMNTNFYKIKTVHGVLESTDKDNITLIATHDRNNEDSERDKDDEDEDYHKGSEIDKNNEIGVVFKDIYDGPDQEAFIDLHGIVVSGYLDDLSTIGDLGEFYVISFNQIKSLKRITISKKSPFYASYDDTVSIKYLDTLSDGPKIVQFLKPENFNRYLTTFIKNQQGYYIDDSDRTIRSFWNAGELITPGYQQSFSNIVNAAICDCRIDNIINVIALYAGISNPPYS